MFFCDILKFGEDLISFSKKTDFLWIIIMNNQIIKNIFFNILIEAEKINEI